MTHIYGQFVIGPPGSGKTTYCKKMAGLLESLGRKVAIINIDPANDFLDYTSAIDINSLIRVEDVMITQNLGPNGALIYCMEFLEKNIDWLLQKCLSLKNHYFLFDCPGQIELYSHHESIRNILRNLISKNFHICTIHLVDSHYCSDPGKFISTLLMSLSIMFQMETPHVNVLSKIDLLIKHSSQLNFGVNFYTEVLDLNYLLESLENDPFYNRYKKLNSAIIELVEGNSLVSFIPLNVNDNSSLTKIKNAADKANGYIFGTGEHRTIQSLLGCAVGVEKDPDDYSYDPPTKENDELMSLD